MVLWWQPLIMLATPSLTGMRVECQRWSLEDLDDIQRSYELLPTDAELQDCIDEASGYAIAGHSFGGYTSVALSGAVIDPNQTLEHCEDNGGWLCGEVETHVSENGLDVVDLSDQRIWAGIPMAPAGYETLLVALDLCKIPMLVMGVVEMIPPRWRAMFDPFMMG